LHLIAGSPFHRKEEVQGGIGVEVFKPGVDQVG
jgi:hypothetical protein